MIPSRHWNSLASINTKKNTGSTEQKQKTKNKNQNNITQEGHFMSKIIAALLTLNLWESFNVKEIPKPLPFEMYLIVVTIQN